MATNFFQSTLSLPPRKEYRFFFCQYFSFDLSTDPETAGIFEEFYGIIDVNGDGEITATEVEQIDGVVRLERGRISCTERILFSINIISLIFSMKWLEQRMINKQAIQGKKCRLKMKISMNSYIYKIIKAIYDRYRSFIFLVQR